MAAGGMRYGDARRPLSERPVGGQQPEPDPPPDPDGRPCWLDLDGRRIPGTVHGWYRHDDGSWSALVLAWLPGTAVRPRA